jgi:hypothetical protein
MKEETKPMERLTREPLPGATLFGPDAGGDALPRRGVWGDVFEAMARELAALAV